jgi:hypothetical protein
MLQAPEIRITYVGFDLTDAIAEQKSPIGVNFVLTSAQTS